MKFIHVSVLLSQFEAGEQRPEETVQMFSILVKSGLAWTLQGMYGRMADSLIRRGVLDEAGKILKETA